jgi:hypothetical protein
MKRMTLSVILLSIISSTVIYGASSERPMLLRVDLQDKKAMDILISGNFDIAYVARNEFAEIVADDFDYDKLISAGLDV